MIPWSPLPDAPDFPASGFAQLADRIADLLGTRNDVVLVQAEAVVALEAAASSLGRPGLVALNVVTSLYGAWFGGWLRHAGATVIDLTAEPGRPITAQVVAEALETHDIGLLAMVHAESATGILNPLPEIMALAQKAGVMTVVDAVASFGGHPVPVDALGIDVAVIGPQKTMGGQAGCSAISISPRAWDVMNPAGEAPSILSLADLKAGWIDAGRGALPGTPSPIEFHALAATLDRIEAEGLTAMLTRHGVAAQAMRAGVAALGVMPWVAPEHASNLVTAGPVPEGYSADDLTRALPQGATMIAPGVGPAGERLVRLNHTGPRACPAVVLSELAAYAGALARLGETVDCGAGLAAAASVFEGA
ncbi:pyridoxal-phosphate-dependent aminotransferase family protein [Pseudorhodobacter aquimaris]|uniref:pyridoxal-phosphate-dependent aminotransferase family protein n=1 Tax=Pseudorhodobacter aquimaris TaxID=687412 RepID=UPI00067E25B6|nr:aminotransferase class V-fold PLP-dependent enzyme [Pseudorhodobacter aquimaris]